ncbi:MAG: TolC family protein [Flavobacteriales bacterium]|nr:TolC family protein [Flavobacteriales bacterium]
MRTIHTITTIIIALLGAALHAQGPVSLSLQQALDMAAKQSYAVQASALEAEKAQAKIKEITGMGLPQISGTGTMQNYIEVPTMVVPNFFGGDELMKVQFGVPWSLSGGVQLNQLIFDGSYLVGLQATRELRTKSTKDLEQTVLTARVQAAKAYLGVLAAEEGIRLIGESLPVLEKANTDARAMFEQGMIESTDSDRLTVQLDEVRNQQRTMQQQARVARAYLNLVLGLPTGTPITLTDALQPLLDDPKEVGLADAAFDVNQHVDQQVAQSMLRLGELDVRNKKAAYLPSLAGFINYQQQYNYTSFDVGNGSWWFPASLWGLQLNVPIFSSGMRHQQVRQAKLSLEQAGINAKATEQRLLAEREQQQAILRAAQDSYETGKKNLALSRSIFDRTSVKFTEGVASSFELTQEHGNYLSTQQNYIQRIVDLLQARADMRKALDAY